MWSWIKRFRQVNVKNYMMLFVGGILFVFYFAGLDYSTLLSRLGRLSSAYVLFVLCGNILIGFIKVVRWRYFLQVLGIESAFSRDYLSVNAAFFLGLVTPGTAGEMSRVMSVKNHVGKGLSVMMFEKFTDLGMLILCALFSALSHVLPGRWLFASIFLMFLCFGAVYFLFFRLSSSLALPLSAPISRVVGPEKAKRAREIYKDMHYLLKTPRLVLMSSIVSLFLWIVPLFQVYLIYRGLALHPSLQFVASTYFIPYLIGIISLIPLGIGVFEYSLREIAIQKGGIALGEVVSGVPVFYRMFVTIPLILFGYACQAYLTVMEQRQGTADTVNSRFCKRRVQ